MPVNTAVCGYFRRAFWFRK